MSVETSQMREQAAIYRPSGWAVSEILYRAADELDRLRERTKALEGYQLAVRLCEAVTASEFGGITTLDIYGEGNWFDARDKMRSLIAAAPSPEGQPVNDIGGVRDALQPFADIGAWLFARDLPDDTPMVDINWLNGHRIALTRGDFKRAHTAREALATTPEGLEAEVARSHAECDAIMELNISQWRMLEKATPLFNACIRLDSEAEEFESDDGAAMMVPLSLWHEFTEALEALAAQQQEGRGDE